MYAMDAEMVARTIQLILAPVVMVSACAILATGLLARYAVINDRLRALARERLDLIRTAEKNMDNPKPLLAADRERLTEIDHQLPDLLRRHKLAHDSVLTLYLAVLAFIANMIVIAAAVLTGAEWVTTLILIVFLIGVGLLALAILFTLREVRTSHHAVQYEVQRVRSFSSHP